MELGRDSDTGGQVILVSFCLNQFDFYNTSFSKLMYKIA